MDLAVETFSLTKKFDDLCAVDGVGLRVERGVSYGFLGPNGAGKSTTIKILTGLLAPTSGTARLLGFDMRDNPIEIKRRIGVVPEDLCLFENLTAREYLVFVARMYRVEKAKIAGRCDELLSLMDLDKTGKKLIIEFSHGMKKKLSLAAALIHDPELLFLDEPFEGVDALASRTIRQVLDHFLKRESTIFLTSHILEIVEKLCTHIGIINKGQLVRQGPLEDLAAGGSLEQAFLSVVGGEHQTAPSLSWLTGSGDA